MEGHSSRAGMSRRAFLGLGATAVAGAAASGLVGCASPKSHSKSSEDGSSTSATAPNGQKYPWDENPPQISDGQVEGTLNVDVAVVGLGVSGCAAFRAAAEAGAKVVGFERGAQVGVRSSQYCYLNGSKSSFFGFPQWDLDDVIKNEWQECSSITNYSIVRKWAYNSAAAFDWWCDAVDGLYFAKPGETVDPKEHPYSVSSMSDPSIDFNNENQAAYPVCLSFSDHQHTLESNLQKGIDLGNDAYFGHFAEQLIKDGDKVTGVYVRNADTGKYKKIMASKGVVLSCGDCGSNEDMMRFFFPQVVENGNMNPWPNMDVEGNRTNQGDGYKMGYWVGAGFSQYEAPMVHVMGGPGDSASQQESIGLTAPLLRLNYDGVRFQNEDVAATECEYSLERQPRKKMFMVFDSHLDEQFPNFVNTFPFKLSDFDAKAGDGTVFKADSLKELFESIDGMNVDAALKSVERYNQMCADGKDTDFGKKAKYLMPVQDGPFYAQRMGLGLCLTTLGGLSSDENAHVLDTDHNVIPGLYVSGNTQGNRFAVKYPFKLSGTSHCMAMYYGKVAGENAAATV